MSEFGLNVPLNSVSFGVCGIAICRELMKRSIEPCLFPIAGQIDLSAQKPCENLNAWIQRCYHKSFSKHSRNHTAFRLWHLNNSLESVSKEQVLLSFWELDSPTESE